MYTYACTHIHTDLGIDIYIYIFTYYLHTHIYIYMYLCMNISVHLHTCQCDGKLSHHSFRTYEGLGSHLHMHYPNWIFFVFNHFRQQQIPSSMDWSAQPARRIGATQEARERRAKVRPMRPQSRVSRVQAPLGSLMSFVATCQVSSNGCIQVSCQTCIEGCG